MGVLDTAASYLPEVNKASVGKFAYMSIISILVLIVIAGLFALWAWWYISKRRFKYKIIIFAKIDGKYKNIGSDRAMERRVGHGGDTVFYIKKLKKIVPTPTIQTGANTYWMAKREDNELINIGMEDIDLIFKEAKVHYLTPETRYARASLQKLNKDRYDKETFWQKYGRDAMTIVFIVVISIMLLLIASKMMEIVGSVDGAMKSAGEIIEKANQVLGTLDNVCSDSGIVPADPGGGT